MSAKCVENALGRFQKVATMMKLFLVACVKVHVSNVTNPLLCFDARDVRGCDVDVDSRRVLAYKKRRKYPFLDFFGLVVRWPLRAFTQLCSLSRRGHCFERTFRSHVGYRQSRANLPRCCDLLSHLRSAENCAENVLTTEKNNQMWRKKKQWTFQRLLVGHYW